MHIHILYVPISVAIRHSAIMATQRLLFFVFGDIRYLVYRSITTKPQMYFSQVWAYKFKNIHYFCSMKTLRLLILIFTCALVAHTPIQAQNPPILTTEETLSMAKCMEISLLTCAPGQEVYSLYGHTALKLDFTNCDANMQRAIGAVVANYGMFSFKKSFFILRFIFGLTDYEIGISDEGTFKTEYRMTGRYVVQQTLNLTDKEKLAIWQAIIENYKPENREYRYNYFYDNCTTRARDMITQHIDGTVVYQNSKGEYPTYRKLIHQMNTLYPWARFGNDMLLGVGADRHTTFAEQQFLPFNLKNDFTKAKIVDANGKTRPLVKSETVLVDAATQISGSSFPLRPSTCAWLLLTVVVIVTFIELKFGFNWWLFDTGLLAMAGSAGVILFLMIFSQHPTVSLNLQLLLLNPLPLIFMVRIVKRMRQGKADKGLWLGFIGLTVAFFLGGLVQDYAEGMWIVALGLLIRYVRRLYTDNHIRQ